MIKCIPVYKLYWNSVEQNVSGKYSQIVVRGKIINVTFLSNNVNRIVKNRVLICIFLNRNQESTAADLTVKMSRGHEQYHPLLDDDEEFISYDDGELEQKYHRGRKIRHGFHLPYENLLTKLLFINLMYLQFHIYLNDSRHCQKFLCFSQDSYFTFLIIIILIKLQEKQKGLLSFNSADSGGDNCYTVDYLLSSQQK